MLYLFIVNKNLGGMVMEEKTILRVLGLVERGNKLDKFIDWFTDNVSKLEVAEDEENPKNGFFTLDYQPESEAFVIEVRTTNAEFADEIISKYEEFGFETYQLISVIG